MTPRALWAGAGRHQSGCGEQDMRVLSSSGVKHLNKTQNQRDKLRPLDPLLLGVKVHGTTTNQTLLPSLLLLKRDCLVGMSAGEIPS